MCSMHTVAFSFQVNMQLLSNLSSSLIHLFVPLSKKTMTEELTEEAGGGCGAGLLDASTHGMDGMVDS